MARRINVQGLMSRGLSSMLVSVALGSGIGSAHAADSTITVTADLYAEPCTVSRDIDINFGEVQVSELQEVGKSLPWSSPQKISLTNCPAGTKTVTATFRGVPDDGPGTGQDLFKNTGSAKGVSIWVKVDDTSIGNGATRSASVIDRSAAFSVSATVQAIEGAATPGTIASTISVTLDYE